MKKKCEEMPVAFRLLGKCATKILLIVLIFFTGTISTNAQSKAGKYLLLKLESAANSAVRNDTNSIKSREKARNYFHFAQRQKSLFHLHNAAKLLAVFERKYGTRDRLLYYDSISVSAAEALNIPDTLFNALQFYAVDFINFNRLEEALPFLKQTIEVADRINKPSFQSTALKNMAFYYYKKFRMKEAQQLYKSSLYKAQEAKSEAAVASVKLWIALTTIMTAKIDSTAAYIFDALEYFKKVKDNKNIAECYGTLGFAYKSNGNVNKALEYHKLAYDFFRFEKDNLKTAGEALNITAVYISKKNYDSASYFLTLAETLYRKMDYQSGLSLINIYWGQYYTAIGETQKAREYFEVANNINKKEKSDILDVAIKGYKAVNAMKEGNDSEADSLLMQTYTKVKKVLPKELVENATRRMKRDKVYEHKKQSYLNTAPLGMFERNSEYDSLADMNPNTALSSSFDSSIGSLYNKQLLGMETQYKTRIISDSLQIEKQNALLAKEGVRNRNVILLASLLLLLVVSVGLLLQYKNRKRAERDTAKIELLQNEIHHRVTNNLSVIRRLVEVAGKSAVDTISLHSLQSRVAAIELLHKRLYSDKITGNVSLQEYLEDLCKSIQNIFEAGKKIVININASINVNSKTAEKIGLITNELVTNSYKYAFAERDSGAIAIEAKTEGNHIIFTVEDNGVGMGNSVNKNYGMKLIAGLSMGIKGSFSFTNHNGTKFSLKFADNEF